MFIIKSGIQFKSFFPIDFSDENYHILNKQKKINIYFLSKASEKINMNLLFYMKYIIIKFKYQQSFGVFSICKRYSLFYFK